MPEGTRGRDPNRRQQAAPLPEYRRAARFPDEPTSNHAYEQAREVIRVEPCDLSLYRTILLPDQLWHVIVLGGMPQEVVRERITTALERGEAVELPEDVWRAFNQRRLEQSGQGPWVERRLPRRR